MKNTNNYGKIFALLRSANYSSQRIKDLAEMLADVESPETIYRVDRDLRDIILTSEMLQEIYSEVIEIASMEKPEHDPVPEC